MASGSGREDEERCREPTIEEIERAVYQAERTAHVAPGMINQVTRHGLLTKKTIDGRKELSMFGSARDIRECVLPLP